ncbi:hypothetical protein ON010_g18155 [Phytophthora cinnamomi]|nr:hypothetical protein ON010_g18155 [Phytophthora cinnamomi]
MLAVVVPSSRDDSGSSFLDQPTSEKVDLLPYCSDGGTRSPRMIYTRVHGSFHTAAFIKHFSESYKCRVAPSSYTTLTLAQKYELCLQAHAASTWSHKRLVTWATTEFETESPVEESTVRGILKNKRKYDEVPDIDKAL